MNLQDIILGGFLEVDKAYGKMFSGAGFVSKLIFYPVALELPVSEVTGVANLEECSEYEVFRRFGNLGEVDSQFKKYLLNNQTVAEVL